eukprot:10769023-Alexandrium_andersonii.AAC.1
MSPSIRSRRKRDAKLRRVKQLISCLEQEREASLATGHASQTRSFLVWFKRMSDAKLMKVRLVREMQQ